MFAITVIYGRVEELHVVLEIERFASRAAQLRLQVSFNDRAGRLSWDRLPLEITEQKGLANGTETLMGVRCHNGLFNAEDFGNRTSQE